MEGLDCAADLDVGVLELLEVAYFGMIFAEADDGESAGVVWGLRRADVEEAGAVWKLNYVIHMRGNADVFVQVLPGVLNGDAWFGLGVGGEGRDGEHEGEARDWVLGHCGRMVARVGGIGCAGAHGVVWWPVTF